MEEAIPVLRPAPFLVFVMPCYNEEEILPSTFERISSLMNDLKARGLVKENSCACYVDDGSKDGTWNLLAGRHQQDPFARAIKFAGNAGQQNALWGGMAQAREWGADCVITLDVDLQDDISVIPEMLSYYSQGCDIVYGVRNNRDTDTFFKRESARLFYALMRKLDMAAIPNHCDYRLMARNVLEALSGYEERGLFVRGIMTRIGFKSARVYYARQARTAGETKYSLRRMLSLAWIGITSLSAAPLRIAGLMSFVCMLLAIILGVIYVVNAWIMGTNIQGWTSLFIAILFMGSLQLFCLAVIGEYIAKIFTEVQHRPRYIIEKKLE